MSTERSIAEIIGWELKTESWPETNYGGPVDKPYVSKVRYYREAPDGDEREPNVDDMLAWLVEKTDLIDVNYKQTTHEWFVAVEIASGDGYHEPRDIFLSDEYCGDSLLAACEETVRAVDPFVNDRSAALEHPFDVGGDHPLGDQAQ